MIPKGVRIPHALRPYKKKYRCLVRDTGISKGRADLLDDFLSAPDYDSVFSVVFNLAALQVIHRLV